MVVPRSLRLLLLVVAITEAFVIAPGFSQRASTATIIDTTTKVLSNSLVPANKITCLREKTVGVDDDNGDDDKLSPPEQTVYTILQDMHDGAHAFRLVVVGNGAILETTSPLGPTFKLGQSPRTGENLVTFASDDSSFEFHLMIGQVSKIVMTQKESPVDGKNMQIFRFLTDKGKPMCSLILADKSEEASKWFGSMLEKYNNGDVQL